MKLAELRNNDAVSPRTAATGSLRGYQPELDGVRFLAFFLVFLHHALPGGHFGSPAAALGPLGLYWPKWRLVWIVKASCFSGLCLFFALSAYLITGLLLAERSTTGAISIRKFYIRRILRIWPLYLLGIVIGVVAAVFKHQAASALGFVWFFLLVGNIYCGVYGWIPNPMMVLWSISLEEQFYLFWPLTMRAISRGKMALVATVMIVAANVQLWYFGSHHANIDRVVATNTFVQFEMFAVGILLAVVRKPEMKRRPLAGACLILLSPFLWTSACWVFGALGSGTGIDYARSGPSLMAGYAAIALGCASMLYGATLVGPRFVPRWMAGLGKISYGLYVYHLLILVMVSAALKRLHVPHWHLFLLPLALLIIIPMAQLSYKYFESPFLRLKHRFEVVESRPV